MLMFDLLASSLYPINVDASHFLSLSLTRQVLRNLVFLGKLMLAEEPAEEGDEADENGDEHGEEPAGDDAAEEGSSRRRRARGPLPALHALCRRLGFLARRELAFSQKVFCPALLSRSCLTHPPLWLLLAQPS